MDYSYSSNFVLSSKQQQYLKQPPVNDYVPNNTRYLVRQLEIHLSRGWTTKVGKYNKSKRNQKNKVKNNNKMRYSKEMKEVVEERKRFEV